MDHARRKIIGATLTNRDHSTGFHTMPARPPWALPETRFLATCTQCNACVDACEEKIIRNGSGNYPVVDFASGECTFCQACVTACTFEALANPEENTPWHHVATANDNCLADNGIACQSCQDSCDVRAIGFTPRIGAPSRPVFSAEDCTGCGACVAVCPSNAILFVNQTAASI